VVTIAATAEQSQNHHVLKPAQHDAGLRNREYVKGQLLTHLQSQPAQHDGGQDQQGEGAGA
jgi:hypothetical protein